MSDVPRVRGDTLRKAMVVVWLANKFEKGISKSELARISGYKGTGLWSASGHDWFIESPEDKIIKLTEKAELYLKENQLNTFYYARMVFITVAYLLGFLALQDILMDAFNYALKYEWQYLSPAIIFCILVITYFYRILWYFTKRKK